MKISPEGAVNECVDHAPSEYPKNEALAMRRKGSASYFPGAAPHFKTHMSLTA
jgi:hypothetical protein